MMRTVRAIVVFTCASIDSKTMHLVWGDSRAGFQGVWYGRVQLSAFEF